ncbi:hypothetical protein GWK08_17535 [Leptobacterium flavescens]|uniref:Uncharacterized protein n=1 Tax=Leptobacterium flavescens TaxID=472055 RepID=A0A6P0UWZ8_9FLAO|nr:hypothetical protein [Leptobacterium flavescens]NER15263.1 hypothetical protein [Leptobacterium flavescens]
MTEIEEYKKWAYSVVNEEYLIFKEEISGSSSDNSGDAALNEINEFMLKIRKRLDAGLRINKNNNLLVKEVELINSYYLIEGKRQAVKLCKKKNLFP